MPNNEPKSKEEISAYIDRADEIHRQCQAREVNPVVVTLLMVGDQIAGGLDGNWHQLENIWQLLSSYMNSH